jgi:hypothetical protein
MGSVNVIWRGSCSDRRTQLEMRELLDLLARRSAGRIRGPVQERSAWLEMLTAPRRERAPLLDSVRLFDDEIEGRILADPFLAPEPGLLYEDAHWSKIEMVAVEQGGADKSEVFCLSLDSSHAQWLLSLSRLRLFGIDFQLFDPRSLYPNSDRLSFVFLESPELPCLTGWLAQAENQAQCHLYSSEVIRSADWYISTPTIHLRYYLEEWSDLLFAWVKYFFVPDLYYWRYESLPHYEEDRTLIDGICQELGADHAKYAVLDFLVDRFEREADDWVTWLAAGK